MSPRITARITAGLLGGIMAFQLALVAGAPWGAFTQGGGQVGTLPAAGRVFAFVSFLIIGLMALSILARANEGPLRVAPRRLITALSWFTMIYMGLAIVLNLITPSANERMIWAPLSALVFVFAVVTMWGTRRRA
jgi:hypothetical protein